MENTMALQAFDLSGNITAEEALDKVKSLGGFISAITNIGRAADASLPGAEAYIDGEIGATGISSN